MTMLGLAGSSPGAKGVQTVPMLACGVCKRASTAASMTAGGISGSSPWALTTMSPGARARMAAAWARREVPLGWSARVRMQRVLKGASASMTCWESVATTTLAAHWARRACSTTCWTIGLPVRQSRTFSGRRVEARRAGTMTVARGGMGEGKSGW